MFDHSEHNTMGLYPQSLNFFVDDWLIYERNPGIRLTIMDYYRPVLGIDVHRIYVLGVHPKTIFK